MAHFIFKAKARGNNELPKVTQLLVWQDSAEAVSFSRGYEAAFRVPIHPLLEMSPTRASNSPPTQFKQFIQ